MRKSIVASAAIAAATLGVTGASATMVTVCCKLPHGIVLEHPADPEIKVRLKGANHPLLVGADYGMTEVKADFWEQWLNANRNFPAVKSMAIFVAANQTDAQAMAKEFKDLETGFERMRTDGKDPRASGVVKAVED